MPEPNTLYPGRPGYTGPTAGMFGLVHHDVLYEWSSDITERVRYIREHKPEPEVAVRLHCLVYLDPVGQTWGQALAEGDRLWAEAQRLLTEGNHLQAESRRLWDEAHRLWGEAMGAIPARIRELVPDLPWDGDKLVFTTGSLASGNRM